MRVPSLSSTLNAACLWGIQYGKKISQLRGQNEMIVATSSLFN